MAISTAVGLDRVSRAVGYKVKSANFSPNTPYLPQRIIVLGEANTANQATLDEDPYEFINAKEAAERWGYGSPMHQMARILRPLSGNPLGGIPTIGIPQLSDVAATPAVYKLGVAVATTVTENATHLIKVNGRDNIDGKYYSYSVVLGEDAAAVLAKIVDAINNVGTAPVTAAINVSDVDITSRWEGATSILDIEIDTQDKDAGIVYSEVSNTAGTGAVDISDALATIGEDWNTFIINPYGSAQFTALEAFIGVPDPDTPTGRYEGLNFFPCCALYGSLLSDKDDVVAVTNASARRDQVANVHCPAPSSKGFAYEAAVNMAMTYVAIAQNTPHLDNSGKTYPDMPVPSDENIGDFSNYDARDFMVKKGSSTVNLTNGKYTVQDFVTTYAPDSDPAPKFRFVRDLVCDWNYGFAWKLIMQRDIQDKTIVPNNTPSRVGGTVSPKQGQQLLIGHIENMAALAIIADSEFSIESIQVGINETNPARLDFFNKYKRTSMAHVLSADAEVDFNYSS